MSANSAIQSPTGRLLAGVLFTLLVIGAYAGYTLHSVGRMREVQSSIVDQNRKAALQLIRIQSDLNALALAMRDMLDNLDGYPLSAWAGQLGRIRNDLDNALQLEAGLAGKRRDPQQTEYLLSSFAQFWTTVDHMQQLAETGGEKQARELVRQSLLPRQEALTALTARLLVMNNEAEQRAAEDVREIYDGVERNAYLFLGLSLALVAGVSVMIIQSNRAVFRQVTELSAQRRELARELISTQESTLRSVSRDLHDEFGQILTAVGAMLKRAGRLAPSEFQEQVREANLVVQESLEKIRALSQSLQPVILDEQGLAAAVQWYVTVFARQTGIAVHYAGPEPNAPEMVSASATHVFRILQEALNNIAKHARVTEAWVRLELTGGEVRMEVRDTGDGIPIAFKAGIGLAGMRERAALIGGTLEIGAVVPAGTRIVLTAPVTVSPGGKANGKYPSAVGG